MSETSPEKNESAYKQSMMQSTMDMTKYRQYKLARKPFLYAPIRMPKPLPDWNQSSSTLQHSTRIYAFPKDSRFKDPKVNYFNHLDLQHPSSLCKRGSSFGIGDKVSVPQVFAYGIGTATKGCPYYELTPKVNSSVSLQKGKTFGLGWNYYEKAIVPHRKTVHTPEQVRCNPGPPTYDIKYKGRHSARQIKMHQRLRMFSEVDAFAKKRDPSPNNYQIGQNLISRTTRSTSMGFGVKSDFTKQQRELPGPIYNIPGFTDKFAATKIKNIGSGR